MLERGSGVVVAFILAGCLAQNPGGGASEQDTGGVDANDAAPPPGGDETGGTDPPGGSPGGTDTPGGTDISGGSPGGTDRPDAAAPGGSSGPDAALPGTDDLDDDGVVDARDNCPALANNNQSDVDADGLGDVCDPCPEVSDPTGEPAACAPECETGLSESRPCPFGERELRTCVEDAWTPWSGCAEPPCVLGAVEVLPCEGAPAVSQTRECLAEGWGPWSVCAPECVPGDVQVRGCDAPAGAEQSRVCEGGLWGAYGGCVVPAACVEGRVEVRPCLGAPALEQSRTCAEGRWEPWSACDPECSLGETELRACGPGLRGTEQRACEGGLWGPFAACVVPPECEAGTQQNRACQADRPGTQVRDCVDGTWGAWGVCVVEPECELGISQRRACGLNGRGDDDRPCVEGFWGEWTCTDPDVCVDGDRRFQDCPDIPEDAVSSCGVGQWGPFSACRAPNACERPAGLVALGDLESVLIQGDTRGRAHTFRAGCQFDTAGGDHAYTIRVQNAGLYRFEVVDANFDTVLSLRSVCEADLSELACNDDFGGDWSRFDVELQPGDYTLALDGVGGATGTATIEVTAIPPPAPCVADDDNTVATARPVELPVLIENEAICPNVDRGDVYAIELDAPGMLYADVIARAPSPGGRAYGGFARGPNGIGFAVESEGSFSVRTYTPIAGTVTFGLRNFNLMGTYGYDLSLSYEMSLTCAAAQRPGCISCDDALEPNNSINESRAINFNMDYGPLGVCDQSADFYTVQLAADRDFRVDLDVLALLGDFTLWVSNGRDRVAVVETNEGARRTLVGRAPVDGRYYVTVRPNPGELSYRLRVTH